MRPEPAAAHESGRAQRAEEEGVGEDDAVGLRERERHAEEVVAVDAPGRRDGRAVRRDVVVDVVVRVVGRLEVRDDGPEHGDVEPERRVDEVERLHPVLDVARRHEDAVERGEEDRRAEHGHVVVPAEADAERDALLDRRDEVEVGEDERDVAREKRA